jgi:hypothetical protein
MDSGALPVKYGAAGCTDVVRKYQKLGGSVNSPN